MAKKIGVVSIKGGVGKTTTCVNVAAYMADMGVPTLLVDLDPQNGVMFGMGLDARETYGLKDALLSGVSLNDALTPTNRPDLRVILAGHFANGEELEQYERAFELNYRTLHVLLERLQVEGAFQPEVVLIDTPAGLGSIVMNALATVHSVILPVQCEPLSLRTLPQMLRGIAGVREKYNPDLTIEGVLATMYDVRQEPKMRIAEQIWGDFPEDMVFETVIPRHEHMAQSFAVGAPVVDISTRSVGAQAYIQLGRELVMRLPEPPH
jgi:chromosome partitioning protein